MIDFQEKLNFYQIFLSLITITLLTIASLISGYATLISYIKGNKLDLIFWSLTTIFLNISLTLLFI